MRGVPRVLALVLIALGVVVATAAAIYVVLARRGVPTEDELRAMSALRRGLVFISLSKFGLPLALACAVGAVLGTALGVIALRGNRLALLVAGVIAVGGIGVVWGAHRMIKRLEDPEYRHRSRYIRTATEVAWAGSIYFAVLGASAITGFVLARRRPEPTPPAPSPA